MVTPRIFKSEIDGLVTLYLLKRIGLLEVQPGLLAWFRIVLTDIGTLVPGITAKLVVTPVLKLVNKNANTSLKPHCHCPYSLEAKTKSKLN